MSDEIKLGRMARDFARADISVSKADDGVTRLSFPLSSEAPVDRWFGTEVLSHAEGAVRMDRIGTGAAPLLFNHDWGDPIGMIDGARLQGGRLVVDAHLFATARAQEVAQMIDDGLRNVSVGYEIRERVEDKKAGTYTATDWMPLEGSIVTVPADASVGIGRAADGAAQPVRVIRAASSQPAAAAAPSENAAMADTPTQAAGDNTAASIPAQPRQTADIDSTRMTAMEIENNRRQAIQNLCRANKIDQRTEVDWIRDGVDLNTVAKQILDIQVQRQQTNTEYVANLGLSAKEKREYSLFRAIRALRPNAHPQAFKDAAYEFELSREIARRVDRAESSSIFIPVDVLSQARDRDVAQRTMATTPGSKGGYMVQSDNMGFIDILRNRAVCYAMGATPMPGLVGNAAFVRQTGTPSITWQAGEATTVTAADQTLGQLSMTPKTAIVITDVSEQLLRQATPSAEAFVMGDLAKSLAIAVDSAAINGTGGAQPLGIKNTTGITSGQDAASVTWDKIRAFWTAAAGSNAVLGRPGWVTTSAGAALLSGKQRFTSTDTPIWEGNPMNGTIWGFPAMSSEQVASGNLLFGSWENLLIGEWGVLELATDNGGTRFNNATVGIRAMWMVDTLLRYPQAFVVSTNLS